MGVGSSGSRFGSERRRRALGAATVVALVLSGSIFGAVGVAAASTSVTNCNDSGTGSLRAAVAGGGTTTFALSPPCSTITLTSGPISLATDVTISGPGAGHLAVSGGGASQVFVILSGVNATISGLTIENGNSTAGVGGGIDNRGGTVTVSNSTVSGNKSAHDGGGICNGDGGDGAGTLCDGSGTVTVSNSVVSGNNAAGAGGGIANGSGTVSVLNSTISGNVTTHAFSGGGGIANAGGTVVLTNSTVSGNTSPGAFGNGGGIYNIGSATITNSTVSGNQAGGSHGGGDGGGIANFSGDTLTLTNSTVSGNTAKVGGSGGGIFNEGGSVALVYSTISGNILGFNNVQSTYGAGGDIDNFISGSMSLLSSIVANSKPAGNDCFLVSPLTDLGYNLDRDGTCALTLPTDLSGVDPQLGALAANGGPTDTLAVPVTSPAFNVIPFGANGCGSTITTDQRGVIRPFSLTGCEIGSFEFGDVALKSFVASPTSVQSGKKTVYTATILNGGTVGATGVTLTDTLPSTLSFVSAHTSVGSCSYVAPTLTCALGSLRAAGTATVKITAKVTAVAGKKVHDTATVGATSGNTNRNNDVKIAAITVT